MNQAQPSGDDLDPPLDSTLVHGAVPDRPGGVIGPYKLMEQIGEGGFGLVYVAEQQQPVKRRVALKVIKPGMDTRDVIARFEAERQALAMMDHPNIARVLDAGATDFGRPYFVMELVRGLPITEYCDKNRLTPRERLELFVSVCQAVQHAHLKGIIHRDIKPSNVLVTTHDGQPVVKVIDFGVAKALHQQLTDKTIYTRFAQMIGTPLYMSPEQAEMSGLDIDTRSDIYSLGVLLYELLTGSTPFDKKRLARVAYDELIRMIREEDPPKPSTRLSHSTESLPTIAADRRTEAAKLSKMFRGDLDWIVMKAMEKNRARRYETASAFAADVTRYLNDEAVEASPPSTAYRFKKLARRHRTALATATAFVGLLIAAVIVSGWLALREKAARSTADQNAKVADEQRQIALAEKSRAEANFAEARRAEENARASAARAQTALEAEASARLQTRKALDEMSSQVISDWLSQKDLKLDSTQEKFLQNALASYQSFAKAAGDSEEVRFSAADAHLRIGDIYQKLARFPEAEAANRQAIDSLSALAKQFPGKARYPAREAAAYNNLATILWDLGKPKDSETAELQGLALRQRLVKDFPNDPTFHQDLGNSDNALAALYSRTHRPKEADEAYHNTLAELKTLVASHPTERSYRQSLANAQAAWAGELSDRGRHQESEAAYRETIALRRKLVAEAPDAPAYRSDLAKDLNSFGVTLKDRGRNKEAEDVYKESLALWKQLAADYPSVARYHELLAYACQGIAILYERTGRMQESEQNFRDSLAARRRLVSDFPKSLAFRENLGQSLNNLGVLLFLTSRRPEAERVYREAIEISRQLAAEAPTVVTHRDNLGTRLYNLAILFARDDHNEQAIAAYREAIAVYRKLAEELPQILVYRRTLAICLEAVAATLNEMGKNEESLTISVESIAILKEMVKQDPKTPQNSEELANSLDKYGIHLLALKKVAEADASFAESVGVYEKLVQAVPDEAHYGEELARALVHQAQILRERRDYAKSMHLLDRARPLLDAALKANPSYSLYQNDASAHRTMVAECLVGAGKFAEALAAAEAIAGLGWNPSNDCYNSACALAQCVLVINAQDALPAEKRAEQARLFSERAIGQLRLAVQKGFTDAANARKDNDLRSLRGRKDFEAVLAEIEAKAAKKK
jgi:eukaryotic-like serine/threonine-protein kinase